MNLDSTKPYVPTKGVITQFINHHYRHFNSAALKDASVAYNEHLATMGMVERAFVTGDYTVPDAVEPQSGLDQWIVWQAIDSPAPARSLVGQELVGTQHGAGMAGGKEHGLVVLGSPAQVAESGSEGTHSGIGVDHGVFAMLELAQRQPER